MRRLSLALTAIGIACGFAAASASSLAATTDFDGRWAVTATCPKDPGGALGYTLRFPAEVRNGVLHGQYGEAGKPASLTLTGTIAPDGTAHFDADGITGHEQYNLKQMPRNVRYAYHVSAKFAGKSGSGSRDEGRVCRYSFVKE